MTWLFHLVGDIHHPLHCTAVFSEQFPNGDKGGNDAFIRIRSSPVKLHSMWDASPQTGTSAGSIGSDVREIEGLTKDNADIQKELDAHLSFEILGPGGPGIGPARRLLNGDLKVAASSARRIAADADVPTAPDGYAQNCGKVGRVQVGKAGLRLGPNQDAASVNYICDKNAFMKRKLKDADGSRAASSGSVSNNDLAAVLAVHARKLVTHLGPPALASGLARNEPAGERLQQSPTIPSAAPRGVRASPFRRPRSGPAPSADRT